MGKEKGGFLTPKAIANRIKAKGLQKLRWFCQMCQKQCRDENGFKCHLTSESHQRQLLLFAENPDEYIDTFSQEFESMFLELVKRRFGTKRVHANIVYQEYISDREHTHMNSTMWETLTDFVKWLGREGKCVVDETEKGWFIALIDRDPDAIAREEANRKKEKMEMDDDERTAKFIQQQIERDHTEAKEAEFTELQRENEEEKVAFSLAGMAKKSEKQIQQQPTLDTKNPLQQKGKGKRDTDTASVSSKSSASSASSTSSAGQKRKSALDEIMEFEEKVKEKKNRRENWLHKGIVVKVVTKKLGEKYYKKKAVVQDVIEHFEGKVKMLDSGGTMKLDQTHLETVIPAVGKPLLVVNGAYRGEEATLEALNEKSFSCSIRISHGTLSGRVVQNVQYEDISKLYKPS